MELPWNATLTCWLVIHGLLSLILFDCELGMDKWLPMLIHMWNVIDYPCPNFNSSLTKQPQKRLHETIIYLYFLTFLNIYMAELVPIHHHVKHNCSSYMSAEDQTISSKANSPPLDKMAAISQTIFSNAFLWMKSFLFWLQFQWILFQRVQLTIIQHWFR